MLHQTERMGELFAEVTVHDSRDAIKHALASAREELDIDVSYLSAVWPGELSSPSASATEQMGSVPVRSTHGRVHGALVCRARPGGPQPDDCDLTVVRVLARVIADQLDREEQQVERWREHAESMGLRALLSAVQARDCATGAHSRSVVALSGRVAGALGLGARAVQDVERVALLHDVGKIAVPDRVLHKAAALDPEELDVIRRHSAVGAGIVRSIPHLAHLAPAVRASHERWDGAGYPDGLKGERIPLASRITFVCDAYDAMTSDRPYRRSIGRRAALAEVSRGAGSQFCGRAAGALLHVLAEREPLAPAIGRLRPAC